MRNLKLGGEWLAAARSWIQRRFRNGEYVTWGSDDHLGEVNVRDVEELARCVASAHQRKLAEDIKRALPKLKVLEERLTWVAEQNEKWDLKVLISNFEKFIEGE